MPKKTIMIPVNLNTISSFRARLSVPFDVTELKVYVMYKFEDGANNEAGVTLITNKLSPYDYNVLCSFADTGNLSGPFVFNYESPLKNISGEYVFEIREADGTYDLFAGRDGDLVLTLEFSG